MTHFLQNYSEQQLLYIVERLRMEYLNPKVADVPTVKVKASEVDFQAIRALLKALAETNERYQNSIRRFGIESEDPARLKQIVLMGISSNIRVSSIILLNKLIAPLQKAQLALAKGIEPSEQAVAATIFQEANANFIQKTNEVLAAWSEEDQYLLKQIDPNPVSAVILTPKPVEYKAVRRLLEKSDVFNHQHTNSYTSGYFNGMRIILRESGPYNDKTSFEAGKAIDLFKPEIILLVGMAGGLSDKKVKIGDIVVGNRSYAYESGRVTAGDFQSRSAGGTYSHTLVELARSIMHQSKPKWLRFTRHHTPYSMRIGTIAAGNKVIETKKSEIYKLLQRNCQDALAVEMEAVGFSTALNQNEGKVKGLNIRSISDLLDAKQEANRRGSKELASENAAAFAFELLSLYKSKQ